MVPVRKINGQNWLPDFFNDFFDSNDYERISANAPAMNVMEYANSYTIELAAPGMTKDDFKIHVNKEGNLVIEMEKNTDENTEKKNGRYLRHEFSYTKFRQTLLLPDNVMRDNIAAKVENGVLFVEVPKVQYVKPEEDRREIEIR